MTPSARWLRRAVLLALTLDASTAAAQAAFGDANDVDVQAFLAAFNDYRASHDLQPVKLSRKLTDDAARNDELQERNGLGHFYMGRASGQNSAWNYPDTEAVIRGWHGSDGHRRNMQGNWTCMGVHKRGPYWTQNFARWSSCD